jgi:hypothetical protein
MYENIKRLNGKLQDLHRSRKGLVGFIQRWICDTFGHQNVHTRRGDWQKICFSCHRVLWPGNPRRRIGLWFKGKDGYWYED